VIKNPYLTAFLYRLLHSKSRNTRKCSNSCSFQILYHKTKGQNPGQYYDNNYHIDEVYLINDYDDDVYSINDDNDEVHLRNDGDDYDDMYSINDVYDDVLLINYKPTVFSNLYFL
jgi:hypothetical protein